jgi:hypothetical protein
MRFLLRSLCTPYPTYPSLFAPSLPLRLAAAANVLLGMINIDLLLRFLCLVILDLKISNTDNSISIPSIKAVKAMSAQ